MVIRMESDKSLLVTKYEQIYQGETRADLLIFLLPQTYGDILVADCDVTLNYVDANDNYHRIPLTRNETMYRDYWQYMLSVTDGFTQSAGINTVSLTLRGDNIGNLKLKTASLQIPITARGEIIDPEQPDGTEQEIIGISQRIDVLERTQPTTLSIENDMLCMQNADGEIVGEAVEIDHEAPVVNIDEEV